MSTTYEMQLPLQEADVRKLRAGDMVYLTGELVISAGLPTYQRILDYTRAGKALPIDVTHGTLLHFGGLSQERDGKLQVLYMNPTTSTRFNPLMPEIILGQKLRAVGGKGGLDKNSVQAMKDTGCVYLSFPGGAATLYSQAIREVVQVEWRDLIIHYRLTKLRVDRLGPGTVGIDSLGNSLYDGLQAQAEARLPAIMAQLNAARAASGGTPSK